MPMDTNRFTDESPLWYFRTLTWLAHSRQTYQSMIVYRIKLYQFLSCIRERKNDLILILTDCFGSQKCDVMSLLCVNNMSWSYVLARYTSTIYVESTYVNNEYFSCFSFKIGEIIIIGDISYLSL